MIINEFRSPCPPEQQYTVCYKIAFVLLFQRKKERQYKDTFHHHENENS